MAFKEGDVMLYGPNGDALFTFREFKPYRHNRGVGFISPAARNPERYDADTYIDARRESHSEPTRDAAGPAAAEEPGSLPDRSWPSGEDAPEEAHFPCVEE